MNDGCTRCREFTEKGVSFCGACGRSLGDGGYDGPGSMGCDDPKRPSRGFVSIILLIACIFVLFIAVFEAITLVINSAEVFGFLSDKALSFFLIVPFPKAVFSLSGAALQFYWIIVTVIILTCAAYAVKRFIGAVRSSRDITEQDAAEDTAAFWITVSMCAMLFINFAVVSILIAMDNGITVPDFGDKAEQMFLMADAAVWEEIVSRLLYIGAPMAVISLITTGKKESFICIFGGFGMSKTAIVLIIISASIFGLAHYPGWDDQTWKVLTTGIMGVFLGYIFVRFGLYAAILLHFITDYLSSFYWMGIGWFGTLVSLLLIAAGVVALYYIVKRLCCSKGMIGSLPNFRNVFIKSENTKL